jgi:hypothetical protein
MRKLVAALALVASLVWSPQPAAATFSNCNWNTYWAQRGASVQCWTNNGPVWSSYRVKLRCVESNGNAYHRYGAWRSNGDFSSASCAYGDSYTQRWMQVID